MRKWLVAITFLVQSELYLESTMKKIKLFIRLVTVNFATVAYYSFIWYLQTEGNHFKWSFSKSFNHVLLSLKGFCLSNIFKCTSFLFLLAEPLCPNIFTERTPWDFKLISKDNNEDNNKIVHWSHMMVNGHMTCR